MVEGTYKKSRKPSRVSSGPRSANSIINSSSASLNDESPLQTRLKYSEGLHDAAQGLEFTRSSPDRNLSPKITKTIEELERLLQEAVKIAEGAWDYGDDGNDYRRDIDEGKYETHSPARKPSAGISSRVAKYLQGISSNDPPVLDNSREILKLDSSINNLSTSNGKDLHPNGRVTSKIPSSRRTRSRRYANTNDDKSQLVSVNRRLTSDNPNRGCLKNNSPPSVIVRKASVESQAGNHDNNTIELLPIPPSFKSRSSSVRFDLGEDTNNSIGADEDGELTPELRPGHERHFTNMFGINSRQGSIDHAHPIRRHTQMINLTGCQHVDISNKPNDFDVHETCQHAPVARNWPNSRKRFTATIACINAACISFIIGIYSGEVPAIQYVIADLHHYTILGNVFLYLGLVLPTLIFWPLPLLHGRKPYTVISLAIALCLQIPQGIAVSAYRSPYVRTYRIILLLSRAASGFALGFANMNVQATLLDLFGASLQSRHTEQDLVDPFDVRQHGGGIGLWLGLWSCCTIGPIALGFFIGACIINGTNVTWGFWMSLLILMQLLLINVISPEVRRSAFRRTVADVTGEGVEFSRISRGEVKMHLKGAGPYWWGEEIKAGIEMCWLMLVQPGFLVLAVYAAWVYAQFTMVLMLIGALVSRYYHFRPVEVGLCVVSLGIGSIFALPFQKASIFSQSRYHPPRTNSMTFQKFFIWSSHWARRTMFMILLPLAAIGYTLTSRGPPLLVVAPCIMVALVGFFSNLVIAECYGLVMETFDTSDLQIGMTGRPMRKSIAEQFRNQRTNFSCYPRISAGFAVIESLKFIFAAAATGVCGRVERYVGAMEATAIVAGILLGLTFLLMTVLFKWKVVQMIPHQYRRTDRSNRMNTTWQPVVLGQPSGTTRKISIFEDGKQSRWSEIRRRNRINSALTGS